MWTRREFGGRMGLAAAGAVMVGGRSAMALASFGMEAAGIGAAETGVGGAAGVDRCSVMLWALTGVQKTFAGRLALAAAAGYRCVEMVDEFRSWSEAEWVEALGRMRALGLTVDAIAPIKLGFADPKGGAAMLAELASVLPALRRLGSPQIILVSGPMAGPASDEASLAAQHGTAVETLRKVAALLEREDMAAVIEPIDRIENPPVYLDSVTEAFALTRAVGSPRVKVLYDFFHEQRTQGNLLEKLEGGVGEVGLVHVADVPGRHQPGTGEIRYESVYRALQRLGYRGKVAMEFYPQGDAVTVLREARVEAERMLRA